MKDSELLCSIAKKIATPAYVFDKAEFRNKALDVKKRLGGNIAICYSIKANPFLVDGYFQPTSLFDKFEVCSIGELRICRNCGIPANMVLFSGVNKNVSEIEEAYSYGVRLFTIESFNHIKYISLVGEKNGDVLPVLIRISADSQFGINENEVKEIIRDRANYPHIDISGIHYFTGTQKKEYNIIAKELLFLKEFCEEVQKAYDFKIMNVEYGLGLGVVYFEDQKTGVISIDSVLLELQELSSITKLTIEMGRYFAGTCGYYFTKIVDCKTNNNTNYAIVDGGMNQLHYDGQVRSMKVPLHTHIKLKPCNTTKIKKNWTICGSICSTEDVICRDVEFDCLTEGDVLAFMNCGAYSFMESMSMFLSREMPQIWASTEETELELLRDFIYTESFNRRMR